MRPGTDRLAVGGSGAWLSTLSGDSSVGIFDARSSYRLDADQLVYRLFAQTPLASEVIERLRRDLSLDRAVRQTAEQMARAQGANGERLIAESMLITEFPGRGSEEYRRALTYAQAAVEQLPASVGAADAPFRSRRFPTTRWTDVDAELKYLLDVLARRHPASSLRQG